MRSLSPQFRSTRRWPWAAAWWLACVVTVGLALPSMGQVRLDDVVKPARDAFEYGDFPRCSAQLAPHRPFDTLPSTAGRAEAWRLSGLCAYFRARADDAELRTEAREAFAQLLRIDPDFAPDPLFVPPDAVEFIDQVRADLAPELERLRAARVEAPRPPATPTATEPVPAVEPRKPAPATVTPTTPPLSADALAASGRGQLPVRLWALLPGGLPQFDSGRTGLGWTLLGTQAAGALTSAVAYWTVESLRDPSTGQFKGNDFLVAQQWAVVRWAAVGACVASWIVGVIDAQGRAGQPSTPSRTRDMPLPTSQTVPPTFSTVNPDPQPNPAPASRTPSPTADPR